MDENALKYTFLIVFTIKTMYTYISHIKKKKSTHENTANGRFWNSLNLKYLSALSGWLCSIFFERICFLSVSCSAALYDTENSWFFSGFLIGSFITALFWIQRAIGWEVLAADFEFVAFSHPGEAFFSWLQVRAALSRSITGAC